MLNVFKCCLITNSCLLKQQGAWTIIHHWHHESGSVTAYIKNALGAALHVRYDFLSVDYDFKSVKSRRVIPILCSSLGTFSTASLVEEARQPFLLELSAVCCTAHCFKAPYNLYDDILRSRQVAVSPVLFRALHCCRNMTSVTLYQLIFTPRMRKKQS